MLVVKDESDELAGNGRLYEAAATADDREGATNVTQRPNVVDPQKSFASSSDPMQRFLESTGDAHIHEHSGALLPWSSASPAYRMPRHAEANRLVEFPTGGSENIPIGDSDRPSHILEGDNCIYPSAENLAFMPKAQIPSSDDNATLVDSAGSSTCLGGATLVETEEASKLDRSTDDEENQRQQEEDQHRLENLRITRIPRVLGLLSTIVYAIFARALWIRGSNDQEVDEHVHSALAIGDNPKPSIELFDADLPQEYPSTAHHLSSDTQAQQQSASPSPRVTGSGRVQKRERDENDEDEDEDDQRTDVKRNKKDNDRKLPCPFYRTDPNTFNKDACKKTFKSFSHLCEHLSATNHELHFQPFPKRFVGHFSLEVTPWPSWARAICLRCLANFNNSPDLHSHLESCRSAQPNKHWASDDASLQFGSKWLGVLHTFCSPFDVLQAWEHHRQNLPAKSHKPRVKGKRHAPPRKPTSKVMDEGGTLEFGIQEHVKNSTALESMYTNALTNALTNGALTAQLESAHAKIADLEAEKREVSDAMALFYPSVNIEAVLTQFRAGQSLPSTAPHQQPLASGAMASPASQATPSLKIDSGYGSLIESCAGDGAVGKDLGLGDDLDADGDTVEKEPITRFFDEAIEESECGREIGLPSMNLS